jgi:hypothetical protein
MDRGDHDSIAFPRQGQLSLGESDCNLVNPWTGLNDILIKFGLNYFSPFH